MANVSELFGDIKSRLGIGNRAAQDEYDEYDDYEAYEEDYEDYGDDYDDYDDGYTTRGGYGNRNTVTTREAGASMPRLVSYSDVRESSRSVGVSGAGSRRSSAGRTMMDSSLPHSMTPEGAAEVSAAASRRHAGGLDSLFSSTAQADAASDAGRLPVIGAASAARVSASLAGSRALRVIRPTEYSQVADVAGMLRAGDAVVLVFKQTPESLEKRLLDFSFGVASALEASVDCIANKVFAITVGAPLSDSEQTSLRTQGIL